MVAVSGADAEKFLNDVITTDVPKAARSAAYGGLLTPQGKVLFDFMVFRDRERFLFDLPRALVADFIKRLTFYRLRAKIEIADLSDDHIVVAAWGSAGPPILDGPVATDPRLATLGFRGIVPAGADMAADFDEASAADYDAHRIARQQHTSLATGRPADTHTQMIATDFASGMRAFSAIASSRVRK